MVDDYESPAGGGEDFEQPLSNSQVPEEYDPATMGDVVSEEDFKDLKWRKARLSQMAHKRKLAEQEAAKERGAREMLERRLAAIEANQQNQQAQAAKPEPEGWDRFSTEDLRQYEQRAEETLHLFALNPDNDDLRKQATQIDTKHLTAVREQLAERAAKRAVTGLEEKLTHKEQSSAKVAKLQQRLMGEFGPDVLNPKSELMIEAAEQFGQLATEYEVENDENGLLSRMAVERAHRKLRGIRDGRGPSDLDRRRLAVEADVRREAAPHNNIAALRAKGDWKSTDKAQDIEIDEFLTSQFGLT